MTEAPVDLAAFTSGFLVEADEHLALAGKNILAVEAAHREGGHNPHAVRELFRSLHTIKGLAAMVGIEPIVAIAHAMEAVLRTADRAGGRIGAAAVDVLVSGLAAIQHRVTALANGTEIPPAPEALLEALAALELPVAAAGGLAAPPLGLPSDLAGKLTDSECLQLQAVAPGRRAVRVDFAPSPGHAERGLNITSVRERVARLGEIVRVIPRSLPRSEAAPGGLAFALLVVTAASDAELAAAVGVDPGAVQLLASAAAGSAGGGSGAGAGFDELVDEGHGPRGNVVRVEVARLDDALEKLAALVVSRFRLDRAVAELRARGADVRGLAQLAQESARQLKELRGAIMRARLVSAAEMLERVPLLTRGLSRATGKTVSLQLDAGKAELDKAVAERVFPAVVHLLRNAVDHAIEPPEVRTRAGKPARGTIRVSCFERANNQLELTVEDDGRGIDAAALAARAGREPPRSEDALLALLTMPGLSTVDEATTTSGRGLGMNIVKRIVTEELAGQITVRTVAGRGTTFVLRIPLSITIVDAFAFRCGPQPFVVPLSSVDEIIEVDPDLVTLAPSGKGRAPLRMLERRGAAVPLVSLDQVLRLAGEGVGEGEGEAPNRKAILVRRNGQPFAFEVDQMLGQQEVVVRPIDDPLARRPGVVGSTDLGDGQPTLVLDLVSLSAGLTRRRTDARP